MINITFIKPLLFHKKKSNKKIIIDIAYIYFSVNVTVFLAKYFGIVIMKKSSGFNTFYTYKNDK